jgi:hypothetical protein
MELKTEVEIEAPPARVWEILTDFGRYPEWNPFLLDIRGELTSGSKLQIAAGSTAGRQWSFEARVMAVDPGHEVRWTSHWLLERLFRGEQFFLLKPVENHGTRFVHGAEFGGVLVKYVGNFLTETARGFIGMNQALKRRAEAADR